MEPTFFQPPQPPSVSLSPPVMPSAGQHLSLHLPDWFFSPWLHWAHLNNLPRHCRYNEFVPCGPNCPYEVMLTEHLVVAVTHNKAFIANSKWESPPHGLDNSFGSKTVRSKEEGEHMIRSRSAWPTGVSLLHDLKMLFLPQGNGRE